MDVISGTTRLLSSELYEQLSRYRYQVFIDMLGWELPTRNGLERDQFDHDDTVHVIVRNDQGAISGYGRLLPTSQPYLLGDVFPQLLNGLPPPSSQDIWELSRFAAVDFDSRTSSATGQFSSPIAVRLLQEAIFCARTRGARRIITVSPVGVERLLRRAGFHAHRAGPPMMIGRHPIFACWIECDAMEQTTGHPESASRSGQRSVEPHPAHADHIVSFVR